MKKEDMLRKVDAAQEKAEGDLAASREVLKAVAHMHETKLGIMEKHGEDTTEARKEAQEEIAKAERLCALDQAEIDRIKDIRKQFLAKFE